MCAAGCRGQALPARVLAVRDPRLAACWAGGDPRCGGGRRFGREGWFDSWVCLGLDGRIDLLDRLYLEESLNLERFLILRVDLFI